MTDEEAAKLLAVMVTAWPDGLRFLDEKQQVATRALYRKFLRDLEYGAADAAVCRLIATWRPTSAQRWPSVAELRAAVVTAQHGRTPTGGEAWGAARRLRGGDEVAFAQLDLALRATLVELGWIVWDTVFTGGTSVRRWRVAIGVSVDDVVADRARFIELYDQLASRATSDRVVGQLAPPIPVRRLTGGAPVLIGDLLAGLLPKGEEDK